MSLLEGKMFTIEALNRIEGFVWPEGAKFAAMDCESIRVYFYSSKPKCIYTLFDGSYLLGLDLVMSKLPHPDWRNSLITREEFESVDGWVRNAGSIPNISGEFDVKFNDGDVVKSENEVSDWNWPSIDHDDSIAFWRYHKPQKQEVKPEPESIETMIRRYKDAKENKRAAIDKLNQAQADVEQAEALEDSLFMAIEAWAESHGFDIRALSESEEKPELVITDWRDLQVGDVIWWSVNCNSNGVECEVVKVANPESKDRLAVFAKSGGKCFWIDVLSEEWKFIRRPEKK